MERLDLAVLVGKTKEEALSIIKSNCWSVQINREDNVVYAFLPSSQMDLLKVSIEIENGIVTSQDFNC